MVCSRYLVLMLAVGLFLDAGCSHNTPAAPPLPSFHRFDTPDAIKPATGAPSNDSGPNIARMAGWTAGKNTSTCEVKDKSLFFAGQEGDFLASPSGLAIDGHATDSVQIQMKVTGPGKVALTWRPKGLEWNENHRVFNVYITHPGQMVTYNAQVSGVKAWRHRAIDQFRLVTESKAEIELVSLQVVSRKAVFADKSVGLHEYSIADRVRPCLFAHCPANVEYKDISIPDHAKFTAGLGMVDAASPTTFAVDLRIGGEMVSVFSGGVENDSDWKDVTVDLGAYAGKKADFILRATCGTPDQIALWSNPVLFEARPPETKASRPRNVLLYIVDALPAEHLDVYGYGRKTGPHIAAFAKNGVRFEHCFSQDTWTKPSMTSLATGVDNLLHKVEVYGDVVPDALTMLPGILRDAGFVTGVITENPHTPPDANQRRAYCNLEASHLRVELGDHPMKWNELPQVTYKDACDFLEKNQDRNFFLYIHAMETHDIQPEPTYVYDPPEPFRSLWASPNNLNPRSMDLYDGGVAYGDHDFQRVLDKLDELGLADDTLVIFMSDHGEAFGQHEHKCGHAGKPYQELIHIPLIMRMPGAVPSGRVVPQNVQLIDVPPTILDFLGLPKCGQFQGWSLRGLIAGHPGQDYQDRTIFSRWAGVMSAVKGTWKLFDDPMTSRHVLFDLARDPGETKDVSQAHPAMFALLSTELADHKNRQQALCEKLKVNKDDGAVRNFNPQIDAGLLSLAYIDGGKKPSKKKQEPPASPAKETDIRDCNVVIIAMDALRADHLGCYGYKRNTSPYIDSIAANGLLFERAYSNASFTCMSVASLFTGVFPSKSPTGIGWFAVPNPATVNMPDLFSKAGFATGFFTNHPVFYDPAGFTKGFLESDLIEKDWGNSGSGNQLSLRALEFVKKHAVGKGGRGDRMMMYLHYMDPHAPYQPSKENYLRFADHIYPKPLRLYDDVRMHIPELVASGFGPGDARFEDVMLRYDAEIAGTDEAVKTLLEGMKDLGVLDRTLVILTADHGEEFLEHGFVEHGWQVYNESIHVPLIFWLPSFIKPARVSDRVSLIDLLPTLVDLMRLPNERTDLDGSVILRRDNGSLTVVAPQKPIISEALLETRSLVRTILDKGCAYIAAQRWMTPAECSQSATAHTEQIKKFREHTLPLVDPFGPVAHEEFYDIEKDPQEYQALREDARRPFAQLKKSLSEYTASCAKIKRAPAQRNTQAISPERQEQINSLGYGDSKRMH